MTDEFGLGYLGLGYALAFGGIVAYLLTLARRQRRLERKLEDLSRSRPQD